MRKEDYKNSWKESKNKIYKKWCTDLPSITPFLHIETMIFQSESIYIWLEKEIKMKQIQYKERFAMRAEYKQTRNQNKYMKKEKYKYLSRYSICLMKTAME
jgi:hypothetical protein